MVLCFFLLPPIGVKGLRRGISFLAGGYKKGTDSWACAFFVCGTANEPVDLLNSLCAGAIPMAFV